MNIEVVYYNGRRKTLTLETIELQELARAAKLRATFRSISGRVFDFKDVSHYYEV